MTESGIGIRSGSKRKRPDEDEEYKDEEEHAVMAQMRRKISSTGATRARGKKSEEKKECCVVGCTTLIPKGKGTACDIQHTKLKGKEGHVVVIEGKGFTSFAKLMAAQINPRMEECARSTELNATVAALKDAQTSSLRTDCA